MVSTPDLPHGEKREGASARARREMIAALKALDSHADPDFDRVARLAATVFGAPIALISLVDVDRVWFQSRFGLPVQRVPIASSFAAATIKPADDLPLVVTDARLDPRFAENPNVSGAPHVRFYAGAPITVRGLKIGALGVMSTEPRSKVEEKELAELADLALVAGSLFELKDEARVRARTSAELIKEEWRHALTLEAGKVGSWVWDVRSGEIACNDILRRMFGVDPMAPFTAEDYLTNLVEPADVEAVKTALEATFEEGVDYVVEFRVAATHRWLIGRGRVYQRDGTGKPLIMMGVNIDVTEAKQAADQTRILLLELNHRVKNTLAMIQSLARQTLRRKPDPQQFIDAFSGRLRTLSEAHGLLADRDWSGIGMVELLHSQIDPLVLETPEQLVITGIDVQLPPDHALGLGLILHELASNAVKFGALSVPAGQVSVSWVETSSTPRRIELLWQERNGPAVKTPAEAGFGTRLIQRSLDKVLESSVELSFLKGGVEARIAMPLE